MGTANSWITWEPSLSIGVAKIDEQHKELIKRFNDLGDAVFDGRGKEEIGKILNFLADYTVTHFRDEEALQELFNYPGLEQHKKIHAQFVSEVQTMISKFEAGELDTDLVVKTVDAVGAWILNHIKKEDMAIGVHLKTKQAMETKPHDQEPAYAEDTQAEEAQPQDYSSQMDSQVNAPPKKGIIKRFFQWLF